MSRILITGSADGLGRAAAETLLGDGHQVIVHARSAERLAAVEPLISRGASAVVGDLSAADQTPAIADQVNRLGPVDAVIHNAGVIRGPHILPVNAVAPYPLTALIERSQRLVYLSSDMQEGGRATVDGLDWSGHRPTASYSDSKSLLCQEIDALNVLGGGRLKQSPDTAREVALEAADGFAGALAFVAPALDVVARRRVTARAGDDHA